MAATLRRKNPALIKHQGTIAVGKSRFLKRITGGLLTATNNSGSVNQDSDRNLSFNSFESRSASAQSSSVFSDDTEVQDVAPILSEQFKEDDL